MNGVEGIEADDVFLGLDIASNTGWAVVWGDTYHTGEIKFDPPRKLSTFRDFLYSTIERWRPAVVFYEDGFLNLNPSTVSLLHMHGVFFEVMEDCTVPKIPVTNSQPKEAVAGNGKMSAKDKKAGAMIKALSAWGYDVKGTDEADALAIVLTGRLLLLDELF